VVDSQKTPPVAFHGRDLFPLALSPGKLAEPLKAVWLRQAGGVSVARGIPVVAAERISDGLAAVRPNSSGLRKWVLHLTLKVSRWF
jgi:hypothetical protein